jgi:hypothetical protein
MIRIRTRFGDKRVYTIFFNGKWITMATGMEAKDADTLMDAGQNHLLTSCQLRERIENAKVSLQEKEAEVDSDSLSNQPVG